MTNKNFKTRKAEQGFTLIELSIVLVIIGLIVGGVLVGQDLIRAAEIRATVTQIEKYNTATNTFRNKYNAIPGDIAAASASAFGLDVASSTGTVGLGDGNGLLEGGASTTDAFIGEIPLYWHHLSQSGYTDGQFGGAGGSSTINATNGAITATSSVASADTYMPPAKLGRGNSISVGSYSGINYFILGSFATISAAGAYTGATSDSLTPTEAYNIDKKTDDGVPSSGSIQALSLKTALTYTTLGYAGNSAQSGSGGPVLEAPPTAGCVNNSGNSYALGTVSGTTQMCALRLRFN